MTTPYCPFIPSPVHSCRMGLRNGLKMSLGENRKDNNTGLAELRAAWSGQGWVLAAVFAFSIFVNLLQLTGPLYMLQVYDRVLGSRSEETLVALSGLAVAMFCAMGLLDLFRAKVLTRIGAIMQDKLDRRVFAASLIRLSQSPTDTAALAAQRDLEAVQKLWASPVLTALFDIFWTPFFILAIFVFHAALGWLALAGGVFLIGTTLLNQWLTKAPLTKANLMALQAERLGDAIKAESDSVLALGMTGAAFNRWHDARRGAMLATLGAGDLAGLFSTITKTFRTILQSAMLGLGAWLVLKGEMTGGAMIAGSILMGRALAPIEQAVAQWGLITRAREGHARLASLLSRQPGDSPRTALPRPKAALEITGLTLVPPGESVPTLRNLGFILSPGQALGVIGPSGAGKSTLARAIIGLWAPAAGKIRLDGATLDQYDPDTLGSYIGYLPQRISLFEGTIAENIARLDQSADPARVVEAAQKAAAHDMILRLPQGYDTRVSSLGGRLSGGQIQRIGLARALYGNPLLLVLDEPNSNLDNDGTIALNTAIRGVKAAGGAVMIMAHRPAAIQECDTLLVIEDGMMRAFGPRDQVLRDMVRNHTDIVKGAVA